MLEFVLGRPKSGKTTEIINRIKRCVKENKRTFLLVPEQQVHVSETMIAQIMPEARKCFEVISFSSLSELVFSKHGGLTIKSVDDNVKHLLMWHSVNEVSNELEKYRKNHNDIAFSDKLLSAITELYAHGYTPELLEEKIEESIDEQFKEKMRDIALIYARFEYNIKNKLKEDQTGNSSPIMLKEDIHKILGESIKKHNFFEGAYVFIDSFTDFTVAEELIVKRIIRSAENTTIAINLPFRGYRQNHTQSISETLSELTSYARDNYIKTSDYTMPDRSSGCPTAFSEIEAHLWDFTLKNENRATLTEDQTSCVNLCKCKNPYDEAERVALKILEEKEDGIGFNSMAVIMRDAESYKGIINSIFDKYNIPYFYSEKTDICTASAARYILASLRAVNLGYRLDDIMTITKTGLCSLTNEECDMFEDYCTTWNINGEGFFKDVFNMNPDGYSVKIRERGQRILEAANKAKDTVIPPLAMLKADLAAARHTPESIEAIYKYITKTNLPEAIAKLCEETLEHPNQIRECSDMLKIYDYILSALSTVAEIFKNDKLKIAELIKAIEIMFSRTDIATVPPLDEYVTVGSASTLRTENIKVAFVLGMCEGEFPQSVGNSAIINNNDKTELQKRGVKLTATKEKLSRDELYFVYRALTTPTEKLYITRPEFSVDGHAKAPSVAWNRILYLFNWDEKKNVEVFDLARIKMHINKPETFPSDTDDEDTENKKDDNTDYIEPALVKELLTNNINLTKSKIDTFLLCPYKYWCDNVLSLREPKRDQMSAADIGTLVHYVLEHYVKANVSDNGTLPSKSPEELLNIANNLTEEFIDAVGITPTSSMIYAISRYRTNAYKFLLDLDMEFRRSSFKIISTETSLRKKNAPLKPLQINVALEDGDIIGVSLGGDVDRIDVLTDDHSNDVYVRIVDYKTGDDTFNINNISEGHELQLPIYLFATTSDENSQSRLFKNITTNNDEKINLIPAAALFLSRKESNGLITTFRSGFILDDPKVIQGSNQDIDHKYIVGKNRDGSPKNHISKDEMDSIKTVLDETVSSITKSIYSGEIPRCPSKKACGYCKIKNRCPVAEKDSY